MAQPGRIGRKKNWPRESTRIGRGLMGFNRDLIGKTMGKWRFIWDLIGF